MRKLAITGGEPSRKKRFDAWPIYTEKERKALEDVLTNHNWGGQPFPGKHGDAFGKAFAEFHTAKYGQAVNTGTVGPVLLINAVPVFVDVDPDTYCLDAKLVERAITPKTKAFLPVHLGMRFADLDVLVPLAAKHGIKIIEDCAHAHGEMWRGKGTGSIGDIGAFSFQSSKLIT